MTSIHAVLTFRETWPLSRNLDLKGVYDELRRLHLFVAVIRASSLRRTEHRRMGPGLDDKKSQYPPIFLSAETEDALVLSYLDEALSKYTRSPEEDPDADWKKWLLSFGKRGGETRVKPLAEHEATGAGFAYRYLAVRRWAEIHEKFLRNRANELSRQSIRALNLLDLPMEVMANVFEFFKHPALSAQGGVDWETEENDESSTGWWRFETLKNARLVCRLFNALASPLLCPILRLDVQKASIDRLRRITASPSLSSGIRGVRLNLNYCVGEIAMDELIFLSVIRAEVNDFFSNCEDIYEDVDDRAGPTRNGNMLISSAISFCQQEAMRGTNARPKKEIYPFVDAIRRGYRNYANLHLEQRHILRHGDFARNLATSLAQLGRSIGLKLCDDLPRYTYGDAHRTSRVLGTRRKTPQIFVSAEALTKSISRPHQWARLKGLDYPVRFETARLLCELPLALHREGVSVDHFKPCSLKRLRSFQPLCPSAYLPDEVPNEGSQEAWGQLFAFSKHLRSFEIPLNELSTESSTPVQERDVPVIETYLRAMLASHRLVNLRLSLEFLVQYTHPDPQSNGQRAERYHVLKSNIFTSPWPQLKRVALRCLCLTQSDLEVFCENLSYELVEFFMNDVKLSSGNWKTIADMLHGKLAQRARLKKCKIKVSALRGGEAVEIAERQNAARNPNFPHQHLIYDGSLELSRMVEQFLKGKCDINPLSSISMGSATAS
ncbi:unnamed protein product [Clonostachys rosea]|uniref:F-box domain-containing protein n=1 Tax=Bionectria ochroleuca TaxID=29856 RepID=A0ABY6UEX6_BIOOC|nr:unnamed protein product [Clonostachys rosea]